jgi:MoCo/4Fe-4S cofactor protein with predicted Tat translocation signal
LFNMSSLNLDPKSNGKKYWKSLDELGASPEFGDYLEREFPEEASELGSGVSRRRFLQVMGAGMALAGVSGCKAIRRDEAHILPYNKMPESLVPGTPQFYATAMSLRGEAVGLLIESHEGRPTKVEGNPEHMASLGATSRQHQASVLDLYNPDRSQTLLNKGAAGNWTSFFAEMDILLAASKANEGAGIRLVTGYNTSPTFYALWKEFQKNFPKAKWVVYEPSGRDEVVFGLQEISGSAIEPNLLLENAKRVVSFDADLTESEVDALKHSKAFAKTRNPDQASAMSRFYMVETQFSATGGMADHRLRVKPSQITPALVALAKELASQGLDLTGTGLDINTLTGSVEGIDDRYIKALASDLLANKGASVIAVGRHQPPYAHALALALNRGLGAEGKTVVYRPSIIGSLNSSNDKVQLGLEQLKVLLSEIDAGAVDLLFAFDVNFAYATPSDLDVASKLAKVKTSVHLGLEVDETATLSTWHLPMSHYLEAWSDAQAIDGTLAIVQPLIEPLYSTQSPNEVLARLVSPVVPKGRDIVRNGWMAKHTGLDFEKSWRKWLHDGLVSGSASATATPTFNPEAFAKLATDYAVKALKSSGIEVQFREHPNVGDGRFANNPWLQELPDPVTKVCWDNVALMGPVLIKKLGLDHLLNSHDTGTTLSDSRKRPMVKLQVNGKTIEVVAWVMPGLADETVLLHTGYGRTQVGSIGAGAGVNAYSLIHSSSPYMAVGAEVVGTGAHFDVACTQDHWSIMNRPIAREGTLEEYSKEPDEFFSEEKWNEHPPEKNLWDDTKDRGDFDFTKGMQWGMVIDFNSCTGCNACVIACQAENNIPTVGKEQVWRGREMHWLRIDRYFSGDVENPEIIYQAMACQQCENAPCEEVCPVAATTHSHEGLNDMAYNRCVGTRYCSNNCPYKVRRFNFYNFTKKWDTTTERFQKNPDVTVRFRGVMEKCTYCVQRVNRARIVQKNKGSEIIPDGAITPACAQACPGDAIVFGNINDPQSRVAKLKKHPRNFGVLMDINTRPRTSYLGRVRNPNPALAKAEAKTSSHG